MPVRTTRTRAVVALRCSAACFLPASVSNALRRLSSGLLLLLEQRCEVHRRQEHGRKSGTHQYIGDDFPRIGENNVWASNAKHGFKIGVRNVAQLKNAGFRDLYQEGGFL